MKSEPDVYGIDDLEREGTSMWEGVRNYQARNFMRDDMKVGDRVLFYHSNAKPPGIAGLARVCTTPYPDHTAWNPKHKYFDAKTDPENPRWIMIDVEFEEKFDDVISLAELKEIAGLEEMMVIKKGMRLSIQTVSQSEYRVIKRIGRAKSKPPAVEAKKAKPAAKKKKAAKKAPAAKKAKPAAKKAKPAAAKKKKAKPAAAKKKKANPRTSR